VVGLVGLAVVITGGFLVKGWSAGITWERSVLLAINAQHSPVLNGVTDVFNIGFSPVWAFAVVVVIMAIMVVARRRLGLALLTGVAIGITYLPVAVIKVIVGRPRPAPLPYIVPGLAPETDPGFPSGHVGVVTAMVVVLVLMTRRTSRRWVVLIVGGLVVVATALSRMYAGAHYPFDVIASVVYVGTVGPMMVAILTWLEQRWAVVDRLDRWMAQRWPLVSSRDPGGGSPD